MTTKARLLVVVNRLDHIEKRRMRKKKVTMKHQPMPERVIYEQAQELARRRNWTVGFTLSIMGSRFRDAGDIKGTEAAFILMQREEERKGKKDPVFTEW
jgi:hypothetical protein